MKKLLRSSLATTLLLALAAALIGLGGVGAVQAAPRVTSERAFGAQIELASIGTALLENGEVVAAQGVKRPLLTGLKDDFQVGSVYSAESDPKWELEVENVGAIDQFVRVSVYKYWVDDEGKAVNLDPSLIQIEYADGWTKDEFDSTAEREVVYYDRAIANGDGPVPLTAGLKVDEAVIGELKNYDGVTFQVEAVVDAVQTHSPDEARTGAWGKIN